MIIIIFFLFVVQRLLSYCSAWSPLVNFSDKILGVSSHIERLLFVIRAHLRLVFKRFIESLFSLDLIQADDFAILNDRISLRFLWSSWKALSYSFTKITSFPLRDYFSISFLILHLYNFRFHSDVDTVMVEIICLIKVAFIQTLLLFDRLLNKIVELLSIIFKFSLQLFNSPNVPLFRMLLLHLYTIITWNKIWIYK